MSIISNESDSVGNSLSVPTPDAVAATENTPIKKFMRANSFRKESLVKILLVGDSGVGKTCILNRFVDGAFNPTFSSTLGIDFKYRTAVLQGQKLTFQIWDTSGQPRFRKIISAYYKGATGIILVYDITNPVSFRNVSSWIDSIRGEVGNDIELMLLGNKTDRTEWRTVIPKDAEEMACEYDIRLFSEASAKNAENIDDALLKFGQLLVNKQEKKGSANGNHKRVHKHPFSAESSDDETQKEQRRQREQKNFSFYDRCCQSMCFMRCK